MTTEEFIEESKKDVWFSRYKTHLLVQQKDFVTWWLGFYGPPSDYMADKEEQSEYWVRCGYALSGWIGANYLTMTRTIGD